MTGNTRDYLADLLNRKGQTLPGGQDLGQSQASAKIDELNKLPDANFPELSDKQVAHVAKGIEKIKQEMAKWTFEE